MKMEVSYLNFKMFKQIPIEDVKIGDIVEWKSRSGGDIMFYRIGYIDTQLWGSRDNWDTKEEAFKQPLEKTSQLEINSVLIRNIWRKGGTLKDFLNNHIYSEKGKADLISAQNLNKVGGRNG